MSDHLLSVFAIQSSTTAGKRNRAWQVVRGWCEVKGFVCVCARVCVSIASVFPSAAVADGRQEGTVCEHRISCAEHLDTVYPHFTYDMMTTCCFCSCSVPSGLPPQSCTKVVCFQSCIVVSTRPETGHDSYISARFLPALLQFQPWPLPWHASNLALHFL